VVLAGALALAGCGLSERPYTEKRQWPLVVRRPSSLPAPQRGKVLLVRSIGAAPGLGVRGLQSLRADGSLDVDFYEEWSVSPAESVESDLRQWLADSGRFRAVVAPGSQLNADLVLEGTLTAFLANPPASTARVALGVVLLDERPNPVKILMQRTFAAEQRLGSADPPGIVAALRAGLADVLHQVEDAVGVAA
jgi:ABC-type uncharacterized transport system auxiliary subunit